MEQRIEAVFFDLFETLATESRSHCVGYAIMV